MAELQTLERSAVPRPIPAFSDHGDEKHIELCGSAVHLKNCGVDAITCLNGVEFGVRKTVTGADGHEWQVWRGDDLFVKAQRQRTNAERVAWIDQMNSRIRCTYFSVDRQSMCCELALELLEITAAMNTEEPMSRRLRRNLKRKLSAMAVVQLSLVNRHVDMQSLREHLGQVGVVIHQTPHFY